MQQPMLHAEGGSMKSSGMIGGPPGSMPGGLHGGPQQRSAGSLPANVGGGGGPGSAYASGPPATWNNNPRGPGVAAAAVGMNPVSGPASMRAGGPLPSVQSAPAGSMNGGGRVMAPGPTLNYPSQPTSGPASALQPQPGMLAQHAPRPLQQPSHFGAAPGVTMAGNPTHGGPMGGAASQHGPAPGASTGGAGAQPHAGPAHPGASGPPSTGAAGGGHTHTISAGGGLLGGAPYQAPSSAQALQTPVKPHPAQVAGPGGVPHPGAGKGQQPLSQGAPASFAQGTTAVANGHGAAAGPHSGVSHSASQGFGAASAPSTAQPQQPASSLQSSGFFAGPAAGAGAVIAAASGPHFLPQQSTPQSLGGQPGAPGPQGLPGSVSGGLPTLLGLQQPVSAAGMRQPPGPLGPGALSHPLGGGALGPAGSGPRGPVPHMLGQGQAPFAPSPATSTAGLAPGPRPVAAPVASGPAASTAVTPGPGAGFGSAATASATAFSAGGSSQTSSYAPRGPNSGSPALPQAQGPAAPGARPGFGPGMLGPGGSPAALSMMTNMTVAPGMPGPGGMGPGPGLGGMSFGPRGPNGPGGFGPLAVGPPSAQPLAPGASAPGGLARPPLQQPQLQQQQFQPPLQQQHQGLHPHSAPTTATPAGGPAAPASFPPASPFKQQQPQALGLGGGPPMPGSMMMPMGGQPGPGGGMSGGPPRGPGGPPMGPPGSQQHGLGPQQPLQPHQQQPLMATTTMGWGPAQGGSAGAPGRPPAAPYSGAPPMHPHHPQQQQQQQQAMMGQPPQHGGGGYHPGSGPVPRPGGPGPLTGPAPLSAREVPGAGSGSQRIDPAAIPRPRYTSPLQPARYPLSGEGFNVPPAAWSDFVATDGNGSGNCNPRFMRCSLGHVPVSRDVLKETRVPLGVLLCPMARVAADAGEAGLAVVDFGDDGPVRCTRCRGYVSPFAKWGDGGSSWTCALCGGVNECPSFYAAPTDQYGLRRDRYERPELLHGSVEFVAPPSYLLRPPSPLTVVFALEATHAAVASGALGVALAAVRAAVEGLASAPEALSQHVRVGVLVFDAALHFFDISPSRSEPGIATAGDTEEAFCPLPPAQFTPRLLEARAHLLTLTDKLIPSLFAPGAGRSSASAGGAALRAAVEAASHSGGRVMAFLSSLPSGGEGRLSAAGGPGTGSREKPALYGADKERELYGPAPGPAGAWYAELAKGAVSKGVGVDIYALNTGGGTGPFMDLGTLGHLPSLTGGDLRLYTGFTLPAAAAAPAAPAPGPGGPPRPGGPAPAPVVPTPTPAPPPVAPVPPELHTRIVQEVWAALLARDTGVEAVLKLRASPGLRVARYLGNFAERAEGEADCALFDSEHSLVALLAHEGSELKDGEEAFLQAALLYTSSSGQRRIRVHNLRLPATNSIQVAFRHADIDTVLAAIMRKGVTTSLTKEVRFVLPDLTEAAIDMLGAYRKHCAAGSSPGQLILPESLKLLPLYLAAVAKLGAFATNRAPADKGKPPPGPPPPQQLRAAGAGALGDVAVRGDARAVELCLLNAMPGARFVPYIYPRLYHLHNLGGLHGVPLDSDDDLSAANGPADAMPTRPACDPASLSPQQLLHRVVLPPQSYPSIEQVQPHGLYLLEHAVGLFLWVGPDLDEEIVGDLWGVSGGPGALPRGAGLPQLRSEWSLRLWTIIAAVRARRPPYLPLTVAVPGDPEARERFAALLVEDRIGAARSYVDTLCAIHASVQARMTQA